MNTITPKMWMSVCAFAVMAMTPPVMADEQPAQTVASAPVKADKTYTGTVAAVDLKEHVLSVKGWAFSKKAFNLGENCSYMLLEKNSATIGDLHAGQKVTVNYQDAHGVLIADRVTQEAMRDEGFVKAMDLDKKTLVVHRGIGDKQMQIGDGCQIVLRNGKTGSLGDIKVGSHVTVTYETPGDQVTARQIAQTSVEFTGTLTAIDLEEKTLKAKSGFTSKKFNLADNCTIVINRRVGGQLADLKPNEKLMFSYDEINGVNVANRIAPVETQTNSEVTSAPKTTP